MNELKVFQNNEFGELEIMVIDGKEYFPATQCAKVLGYAKPADAVRKHCKGVSKIETPTNGGIQKVGYIPEGDLYRLIINSKLPTARKFKSWVFDEVLPEIRRTGSYGNVNVEEVIVKAVTLAVSETIKALVPLMKAPTPAVTGTSDNIEPKRIRKKYRHTTPSKISMLEPELKQKVDEMIISGEYFCQQIANFIMNNSDIEISQMAVNKYKRRYFI